MKKIILILLIIPNLIFGQTLKSWCIGLEIGITTNKFKLLKDGGLSEKISGQFKNVEGNWKFYNDSLHITTPWKTVYSNCFITSCIKEPRAFNNDYMKLPNKWYYYNDKNKKIYGDHYTLLLKNDVCRNFFYHLNAGFSEVINERVSQELREWAKKGEFEKTIKFNERVNENSTKDKRKALKKEVINYYKKIIIDNISSSDIELHEYNADNETFLIKIAEFETINFPVPISQAQKFKENFNPSNFSKIDMIYANEFIISRIELDGFTYNLFSQD